MGTESREEVEEVFGERKAVCKLCCSSKRGILSVDVLLSAHGLTSHYFCLLFRSHDDTDDHDDSDECDANDDNFDDYDDCDDCDDYHNYSDNLTLAGLWPAGPSPLEGYTSHIACSSSLENNDLLRDLVVFPISRHF